MPKPIRSSPGDRRRTRSAFFYREPYEETDLRGYLIFFAIIAVWWGIDWLVHVF